MKAIATDQAPFDECGICEGNSNEGECDCNGNVLVECGICGGTSQKANATATDVLTSAASAGTGIPEGDTATTRP